ncbi:MAG: hypothetical protein A2V52_02205 [Actinobacteria bacterium RBG_19FT_COMBO_54_7]|uniref:Methyltransferase domain-containing protein n=1 Tax=Candidatus Solincola sediminis TaxID=1797199 RepID=A0A1F2WFC5_9ACTN|nr:MAG: hypothetical protein A2Y75_09615 [Candidatus Solincola sediminis]OFW66109.1 MAG: hypothetical protein A2V52_02205 [Actinobacteria bacterium RBG_19FT_COMBO_54_7]
MADWDNFSTRFDNIFLADPLYLDILEKIVAELDADDKDILDIGCGTGNLIARILEELPGARVAAVDPSQGMRDICSERFEGSDRVSIAAGHALAIPFPDAAFDDVVTSLALHHVHYDLREDCVREIARVLKPGGRFICADTFCGVPGRKEDTARCRDIIEKVVAKALLSLEHGAYEMMLITLAALVPTVTEDGEYWATVPEWLESLSLAGFQEFKVIDLPPLEIAKIICAAKVQEDLRFP